MTITMGQMMREMWLKVECKELLRLEDMRYKRWSTTGLFLCIIKRKSTI